MNKKTVKGVVRTWRVSYVSKHIVRGCRLIQWTFKYISWGNRVRKVSFVWIVIWRD